MRKATSVIMGVAGASAIGASWAAGLTPKHDTVSGVTLSAPPAAGRSTDASTGRRPARGPASSPQAHERPGAKASSAVPRSRTVDGGVAHTQYGDVQVSITVVGSRIADVTPLHLTDSSRHSVRISAQAAPVLRSEALRRQSAQIDMVSGATYTSDAYRQSLQSAIDAAHLP